MTTVTLGTATPGGGFPAFGAAFAETVHEADPSLAVETRNTGNVVDDRLTAPTGVTI